MSSLRPLALAMCLSLTACPEHSRPASEVSGDPVAEGCKNMDFGEAIPVDTTTRDARIETTQARFDLILRGSAGNHYGDVLYTSPGGRHYFLFDAPTTFRVKVRQGVRPDAVTVQPESCPSAALAIAYTLEAGEHQLDFFDVESARLALVVHLATTANDPGNDDDQAP